MRTILYGLTAVAACLLVMPVAATPAAEIPAIFAHAIEYQNGEMVLVDRARERVYPRRAEQPLYTLASMEEGIRGSDTGLVFELGVQQGTLYYGLIDYRDGRNPQPVFYKKSAPIKDGKAQVAIAGALSGKYDMSGWERNGKGTLGYRVVNAAGSIIYDGRVSFVRKGAFLRNLSFLEGPTVHNVSDQGAVIAFECDRPCTAVVRAGERRFRSSQATRRHEVRVTGLEPATSYQYRVQVTAADSGRQAPLANSRTFAFRTAPRPGTRQAFVFAYASDSRDGQGGGERDIHGTNAYVMKKLMAVAQAKGAAFLQFSGDMIDGRLNNVSQTRLQYRNWKRAVEPFAHYLPVYATIGNHEGLFHTFDDGSDIGINVARFPFATESAEAVFADMFVMPENGPVSEDGAEYDPRPERSGDFPPYRESVYYYVYDNVAMVVLNSNYLFSRSYKYWFAKKAREGSPLGGGGLHGYLMDRQLEWLERTLARLEADPNIDFIFVTQHTPAFPNGGHRSDDMWYDGNNTPRPSIAGKPLRRGVIEQRDRYLELLLKHKKVVAQLTGDEHNYARMLLTPETVIHPGDWDKARPRITRTLWQINNGAAGAPYYAQEVLPWSDHVKTFSTQIALVLFHVHGRELYFEVINPETLERIE